ncbi:hypothetical protein MCOR12_008906 [Pyricularia oryzae]|nr:hypothetical protein MCOR12_008906 [Pyricularia oryzae]
MQAIYPPSYDCITIIDGDPDIGGPGVMFSFIAISWLTIFVAGLHNILRWKLRRGKDATTRGPGLESIAKQTREFLGTLCDLQILTGLAITIAGWTQHATISYYHQQLVLAYWSLALNSFWAARVQYLDVDSKNDDGTETRDTIRCIAVLCNCLVALTFNIHVEIREQQAWDDDGGPCYNFLDGTSSLVWTAGVALLCIAITVFICPGTRFLIVNYLRLLEGGKNFLQSWYKGEVSFLGCKICTPCTQSKRWKRAMWLGEKCIAGVVLIIYFAVIQWLDIWSYGYGFYGVNWVAYFGFSVWSTLDVISLWRLNIPLVVGDEGKWGFGQVIPQLMILAVIFPAFDILRELAGLGKAPGPSDVSCLTVALLISTDTGSALFVTFEVMYNRQKLPRFMSREWLLYQGYCSHQACKHPICEDKCIVTGKDGFAFPPGLRIPTNWICLNEKHLPEDSNTQIIHSIGELLIPQVVECYCEEPIFTTDAVYDQWGNRMATEFMPKMYADCPYVPLAPRLSLKVIEQREMATAAIIDVAGMAAWEPIVAKLKAITAEGTSQPPPMVASESQSTPAKVNGGLKIRGSAGTKKRKAEAVDQDAVKKPKPVRTSKRLRAKKQSPSAH